MRLDGKVAVVTGAARGIGLAVARACCAHGAVVVLTDVRDELGARETSRLRDDHGARAVFERLDVRLEGDWERVLAGVVERYGGLHVLVNNAGVTGFGDEPTGETDAGRTSASLASPERGDPEHASLAAWRSVFRTNTDGVFLGCKHGIRAMRASRVDAGSIINIGSRSGVVGTPAAAAYAASKAAVRNHTKSVALYCAQQRLPIRCNVIQPAAILTPMWEPMLGDGPDRERRMAACVADCPLGRFGTPDEVAALAVHLAADESAYTTGAEFTIDGGILAGGGAAVETQE